MLPRMVVFRLLALPQETSSGLPNPFTRLLARQTHLVDFSKQFSNRSFCISEASIYGVGFWTRAREIFLHILQLPDRSSARRCINR